MIATRNSRAPNARASPVDEDQPQETSERTWFGRKKNSEWVFRPLRLKFKVKELEELYKNAVYRQQQWLLMCSCFVMVFVSFLGLIAFLASGSVRVPPPPTHTQTHHTSHTVHASHHTTHIDYNVFIWGIIVHSLYTHLTAFHTCHVSDTPHISHTPHFSHTDTHTHMYMQRCCNVCDVIVARLH